MINCFFTVRSSITVHDPVVGIIYAAHPLLGSIADQLRRLAGIRMTVQPAKIAGTEMAFAGSGRIRRQERPDIQHLPLGDITVNAVITDIAEKLISGKRGANYTKEYLGNALLNAVRTYEI